MERFFATYLIETALPVDRAAAMLAGEQSSGTFVAVPGETEDLKAHYAARVERITLRETRSAPSLPGSRGGAGPWQQAEVVVSWPVHNPGFNLPTLVATIQGNLYELSQFSGLKLMNLDFPDSYIQAFRGPRFGVAGCRELTGVFNRPLIGTIIKPSIGLTIAQTSELVRTLVTAGIDFIKDDELQANAPHSPLRERVTAVMAVINDHAQRTGRKVMYAFNISDEIDAMRRHYDWIVQTGGTCAMVSLNSVGLAGVKHICDQGALAIHGHRNGWGALNRHPMLGVDFAAYQKLWRLAGVDQIHVNGIGNKFWESDDSVVHSIRACREPLAGGYSILPVVSSGQWGGQAPETYRRTATVDLLYLAGGGILAHPEGPAAGVHSLRLWWAAAVAGLTPAAALARYPALQISQDKFGRKATA